MKAYLKNYRQSPRKVRIIGNLVKGKSVGQAMSELNFLIKRGSAPIKKLIASAVANAKVNDGIEAENLIVKSVTVDKGLVMKRIERKARGASNVIHKKASNVWVVLETRKTNDQQPAANKKKEKEKVADRKLSVVN